jgi:hypothetical protein
MFEEKTLSCWGEFEEEVNEIRRGVLPGYKNELLFRGQANSEWKLRPTLFGFDGWENAKSLNEYIRLAGEGLAQIESATEFRFNVPDDDFKAAGTSSLVPIEKRHEALWSYLVFLRHYGFPSPLLDWSQSQYVAAYFAFSARPASSLEKDVSIYVLKYCTYNSYKKSEKILRGARFPFLLGQYIRANLRHFMQQSEYSICMECRNFTPASKSVDWILSSYEDDGSEVARCSDSRIYKYCLPRAERKNVLKMLDRMNVNGFTLFGNPAGLMDALAVRSFEL